MYSSAILRSEIWSFILILFVFYLLHRLYYTLGITSVPVVIPIKEIHTLWQILGKLI